MRERRRRNPPGKGALCDPVDTLSEPLQPHLVPHFVGDDGGSFLEFCVIERADPKCHLWAGHQAAVQGPPPPPASLAAPPPMSVTLVVKQVGQ